MSVRYIHSVAPHESFVASGTYVFYENDIPSGLVEHWSIHELPDGAWFMRVDRDGRTFDGRSELIEAWRNPQGVIERFDLFAFGAPTDSIKHVEASYMLTDDQKIMVGRRFNHGERHQMEMMLPPQHSLQPGGYIFFGLILPQIAATPPFNLVSRYSFHEDPAVAFSVGVAQAVVTAVPPEPINVSGQEITANKFLAGARNTAEDAVRRVDWHAFYTDAQHVFVLHEAPNMFVKLERYAHRPVKSAK